jgi:molybdenum cofactor biosynthesis enzyme MoaA
VKIQTLTMTVGGSACNASCPFCVSHMTPANGVTPKAPEVNWRNFHVACRLAKQAGVTTVLLTGKGEPTLWPIEINRYLEELREYDFPFIELQTNGVPLARNEMLWRSCPPKADPEWNQTGIWYDLGLTTVAISIVHFDPEANRQVYMPLHKAYIDLPTLIARLRGVGYSVRLTCTMCRGGVDDWEQVQELIRFANDQGAAQLTIRPVTQVPGDSPEARWIKDRLIPLEEIREIRNGLQCFGTKVMTLPHGGEVFDVMGQNVCLTDCLTIKPDTDDLRQIIYFPDGRIAYDWRYEGARLL